jgi:hypothetical protein
MEIRLVASPLISCSYNFHFLSRYLNGLCCRYVQRIPLRIYIFLRNADFATLSRVWKKKVKVGSIIIADAINTLTMRIIIFLLSSANIVELHTLDLIRVTHIEHCYSKCWNNVKKLNRQHYFTSKDSESRSSLSPFIIGKYTIC